MAAERKRKADRTTNDLKYMRIPLAFPELSHANGGFRSASPALSVRLRRSLAFLHAAPDERGALPEPVSTSRRAATAEAGIG
jgi:hypothetical protein